MPDLTLKDAARLADIAGTGRKGRAADPRLHGNLTRQDARLVEAGLIECRGGGENVRLFATPAGHARLYGEEQP